MACVAPELTAALRAEEFEFSDKFSNGGFRRQASAPADTYLSQHLQQPRQSLLKPNRMTMIEKTIIP
jgi:hypothetical protein